ncbi:MAG: Phytanoyl-CoA dioxygenase [Verrucomicrobia bacterium]|nr:Phytanoyl-CoA dioxygenase [Verrucomicrobiota bacterium]
MSPSATRMAPELFNHRLLTSAELATFQEQGFLVLKSVLTPAGIHRLVDECMAAWTAEKGPYDPTASWLENALLPNIHHRSSAVRDYYFEGPLVEAASQIIGPNLKGVTSQLTFKMRGNTKPFAWHQDNGYGELEPYNAVTCLTALEDNDRETGCLWIIPGSHKQGQIASGLTAADKQAHREIVIRPDESKAVPMPLRAGDCLIFSCWTLHKSEGNFSKDRDRRVLFFRYADADAVEVYNDRKPRLGRLVRGRSRFAEVRAFEQDL